MGENNSLTEPRSDLDEYLLSEQAEDLFTRNDYKVDYDDALRLITRYSNSIDEFQGGTGVEKQEERYKAINKIKQFVKELDPSDPKLQEKLCCSLQMLGRIHDKDFIIQYDLPFSTGFILLKAEWEEHPTNMVSMVIDLLNSENRTFDRKTQGGNSLTTTFSVSPKCKLYEYDEATVDSLLITSLYGFDPKSSPPH